MLKVSKRRKQAKHWGKDVRYLKLKGNRRTRNKCNDAIRNRRFDDIPSSKHKNDMAWSKW